MRTEEHRPIRLQGYRPPDWLIETVDLDVSLHPTATTVRAKLKLTPNSAGTPAPLVLDGDEIKLKSLALDGKPLPADVLPGRDASAARIAEVREALAALAAEIVAIGEVHDVRVRETRDGEIVNFHCQVDPALSVGAVHDMVDALERRLRRRFPSIQRVIGHAEPRQ